MSASASGPFWPLGDNPLSADQIMRYADALRELLSRLDGQVVSAALVCECKGNLLSPVREKVNCIRKLINGGVGVAFEFDYLSGRGLALLDAFENELLAAQHNSSPVCSGPSAGNTCSPALTVQETTGTASSGVGVAGACGCAPASTSKGDQS